MKQNIAILVAVTLTRIASSTLLADIVPIDQKYGGKTYGEWSAAWWKWWLEIDYDTRHPARDLTGDHALRNQSGPVYFLTPAAAREPVTRRFSIPEGVALFLPVADAACTNVEEPPFFGADEVEQRACALRFEHSDLSCEIDGIPVANLLDFRNISETFHFTAPTINALGVPGGTTGFGVGAGVHLLIAPLPPGSHSIHFTTGIPELNFFSDVTYMITVNSRPSLTVRRLSGPDRVEISWKSTSGFGLEASDRLDGPWVSPTILSDREADGSQVVTLPIGAMNRYFRLAHP